MGPGGVEVNDVEALRLEEAAQREPCPQVERVADFERVAADTGGRGLLVKLAGRIAEQLGAMAGRKQAAPKANYLAFATRKAALGVDPDDP